MTATIYSLRKDANPTSRVIPLQWPAQLVPAEMSLNLAGNSTQYENQFNRVLQAATLGDGSGAGYSLSFSMAGLDEAEKRTFAAFIARLRGCAGRFLFPAYPGTTPSGSSHHWANGYRQAVQGEPQFAYDAIANNQILMRDAPTPGGASYGDVIVKRGAYISFDDSQGGRQLCIVVEDAKWDSQGTVLLTIEPPVARLGAAGRFIDVTSPSGLFKLNSDTEGAVTQTPDRLYNVQVNATSARFPAVPTYSGLHVLPPGYGVLQEQQSLDLLNVLLTVSADDHLTFTLTADLLAGAPCTYYAQAAVEPWDFGWGQLYDSTTPSFSISTDGSSASASIQLQQQPQDGQTVYVRISARSAEGYDGEWSLVEFEWPSTGTPVAPPRETSGTQVTEPYGGDQSGPGLYGTSWWADEYEANVWYFESYSNDSVTSFEYQAKLPGDEFWGETYIKEYSEYSSTAYLPLSLDGASGGMVIPDAGVTGVSVRARAVNAGVNGAWSEVLIAGPATVIVNETGEITDLSIAYDFGFGFFTTTATMLPPEWESYELQWRDLALPDGPWNADVPELGGPEFWVGYADNPNSLDLTLPAEVQYFEVRMRAFSAGVPGVWSNVAQPQQSES